METEGGQYVGEYLDGKPHGRGTMLLPSSYRYEGEWRLGQPHGYGTLYFKDERNFYQGMWLDGKRHGKGLLMLSRSEWRGEFRDGEFYYGMWQFEGDASYGGISERYLGKPGGLVSLTSFWKGGERYVGIVDEDGTQRGEGILYSPDGSVISSGIWDYDSVEEQYLDPLDYPFELHQRCLLPWLLEDVNEYSDDLVYVATSPELPNMVFVDTCRKDYRGDINLLNLSNFTVNFFCSCLGDSPWGYPSTIDRVEARAFGGRTLSGSSLRRRGKGDLGHVFQAFETSIAENVFRCSAMDAIKILTIKYGWKGFKFYVDDITLAQFVTTTLSEFEAKRENPSLKSETLTNAYRSEFLNLNSKWRETLGKAARSVDLTFIAGKQQFDPPKKSSLGSALEQYGVISGNRYKQALNEYERRFAFALSEVLVEKINELVIFPPTHVEGICWHCRGKVSFTAVKPLKARRSDNVRGMPLNAQSVMDTHIKSFELTGCYARCRQCNSNLTLNWAAEDCAIQNETWLEAGIFSLFDPLFASYFPSIENDFSFLRTLHILQSKL
jgi:hypothetical protein